MSNVAELAELAFAARRKEELVHRAGGAKFVSEEEEEGRER